MTVASSSALDLASIRAIVRFRGDYQNVQKFPNKDVDTEIQGAFGEFYEIVDDVHEGWWDTNAAGATVANQDYAALPADCWRVKGVDLLESGEYTELQQVSIHDRNRFGSTADQPVAYRLTARGADLYPAPNAVYTLRFVYTPKAPLLQEAAVREWFNGWHDYVVESTLLRLDKRERKPLGDRITALDMITKRIKSAVVNRKQQEPEYLPLREIDDQILPYERGIF